MRCWRCATSSFEHRLPISPTISKRILFRFAKELRSSFGDDDSGKHARRPNVDGTSQVNRLVQRTALTASVRNALAHSLSSNDVCCQARGRFGFLPEYDEDLADVLYRLRSGAPADFLEDRLAPGTIGAVHANLYQLVALQAAVDF